MNKTCLRWLVAALLAIAAAVQTAAEPLPLAISQNGRYLVHSDGTPFFYLGDTAWELFHRLDRDETVVYLDNRAARGFTVIQAVALAEFNGLHQPNRYGERPLVDDNPARPNDAYFEHVDWVIEEAGKRGLYVGLLPSWGDKWNLKWGVGPEVFTVENARAYGKWLGERYKGRANIIWILGGDRNPETEGHTAIVDAMAAGLRAAVGERQLMTYHPQGWSDSSRYFHDREWLDFNMFQSGHSKVDAANYGFTEADYAREPVKPVLDGEPRYEDHPIDWKPDQGWFGAFDVRQAGYWSMLSGAAGHTYGNHNVWQMLSDANPAVSWARTPWPEAILQPGAEQMGYMRRLFEARAWYRLVPDQSLLVENYEGGGHIRAARAEDGSCVLAYSPFGEAVTLSLKGVSGKRVRVSWFDPRLGKMVGGGEFERSDVARFVPPSSGRGNDWLLIVDDAGAELPALP